MADPVQELREVLAAPVKLTVAGQELAVRELLFGEWPDAIERLAPAVESAFSQVMDLGLWFQQSGLIREGERIRLDGKLAAAVLARLVPMLSTMPHALRFGQWLAATCTGQKLEFIQQLPADQGLSLCMKAVEVNAGFFVRKLWPMLGAQLSRIPGLPQSESSREASGTASPGQTSSSA